MNFSAALNNVKAGLKLYRTAWSQGKFIYLVHGSEFEVNRPPLNAMFSIGTKIKYRPHLDCCQQDGTCGTWTPSDEDLLAEDWANVVD